MANADDEISTITGNKENSNIDHNGIEANDLVSLLCQFEEATTNTTSVDDINLQQRETKRRKDILSKAKSAGNSPAVTPPATPPPHLNSAAYRHAHARRPTAPSISIRQPIQLKLVLPATGQKIHSSTPPRHNLSVVNPAGTPSLKSLPNAVVLSNCPQLSFCPKPLQSVAPAPRASVLRLPSTSGGICLSSPLVQGISSPQVVQSIVLQRNSNQTKDVGIQNNKLILPVQKSVFHAKPSPGGALCNLVQDMPVVSTSSIKVPSSINTNHITSLTSVPKLKTPLTVSSTVGTDPAVSGNPQQNQGNPKTKPLKVKSQDSTQSRRVKNSEKSLSDRTGGESLLQSMLLSSGPMPLGLTSVDSSSATSTVSISLSTSSIQSNSLTSNQSLLLKSENVKKEKDHAYCFFNAPFIPKRNPTKAGSSHNNDAETEPEEQEVEDKFPIENGVKMEEQESDTVNECVLEEGEVFVDDNGNDMFHTNVDDTFINSDKEDEARSSSNRIVSFGLAGEYSKRRSRKYRRRMEFGDSPIREDAGNFFDKIPSHYTALSIPTKPVKTTVFASAMKSLGSTDHLELLNKSEIHESEGHYDKVPAHRKCFTNTTKELEILPTEVDVLQETEGLQHSPRHRSTSRHSIKSSSSRRSRRSSSSHHSHISTSSHCSAHSVESIYSPKTEMRQSRSQSPVPSTSHVSNRRSRSMSRSSSRSCSTCSSRSFCSTCSGSLSRSRSRSSSQSSCCSGSRSRSNSAGSEYSRSRSRSAGTKRERQLRGKRSRPHFSPSERRSWSRQHHPHSGSRSRSPSMSRQWRSPHSHHHRSRSRNRSYSSSERNLSEKRKEREKEKIKAMEERRVVYVGKIPDGFSKRQLRRRFERFGEIKEVKVNFREHGDNYGFVTFAYACDAIAAKEKGNNIPGEQKFDLCFGGRRRFCPDQYADLDGNREIEEEYAPMPQHLSGDLDYAALLRQHTQQQRKKN